MGKKLILFACSYFFPEIYHVLKNGEYEDVELKRFCSDCKKSHNSISEIDGLINGIDTSTSDVIVIGNACQFRKIKYDHESGVSLAKLEQCFELLINKETVEHYITKGYYIVGSGWINQVELRIKEWGFDKSTAQKLFTESFKGLLFLDTRINDNYLPKLKYLSEFMGLPYQIIPVGLSHCKQFLDSLILNWRIENERKIYNRQISSTTKLSSDYTLILSQLKRLINYTDEEKIVHIGFELINVLFAPVDIKYIQIHKNREELISSSLTTGKNLKSKSSFKIPVQHASDTLGIFEIISVKFPEYMNRYKEIGTLISQIFGLAITNARRYQIIVDQKEQLEEYSNELNKSNQAKDKFFSIIAHDLKGPFNTLIRLSDFLKESINEGSLENLDQGVGLIQSVSKNTYRLLLNLLEWSQTQSGHVVFNPVKINLTNLSKETFEVLKYQADAKNIDLTLNIAPDLQFMADKNMIKTILRNLLSNAIKYTKEKGKIELSAIKNTKTIHIKVSDSGVGIPAKHIKKLFSLDQSISTPGTKGEKGTALGLILSKEYVDRHKGEIWVESKINKGSIFHISFPSLTEKDAFLSN